MRNFSEETARIVLNMLAPGSDLTSMTVPNGSFSNFTHVVEARSREGDVYRVVVRRYKVFGDYDLGGKARREFGTFELLSQHDIPAPTPLLLDESGNILGSPGIVVSFMNGRLKLEAVSNPVDWARKLAHILAKIHSIPCGEKEQSFLLKGNAEATWFLKTEEPPVYMQQYPDGADLWHILHDQFPKIQNLPPVLLHLDYWSGNILWDEEEISSVLDWEEAAYGDPAVDVGYALMNMVLMGLPDAADEFLHEYESETRTKLKNLGFWELAAAVRPMTDPQDWKIDRSPGRNIFQKFIEEAKQK